MFGCNGRELLFSLAKGRIITYIELVTQDI